MKFKCIFKSTIVLTDSIEKVEYKSIACVADSSAKAQKTYDELKKKYKLVSVKDADVIVALGGDGYMLHILHEYMATGKPIYGVNCGTVGFLMNEYKKGDLLAVINQARLTQLHPLKMKAITTDGKSHNALAINEVSMLRQSGQTANLKIDIDGKTRMKELVCDGVLVATPAGSTAYNYSVYGPILPLRSNILALTPISPFRPRRWRGALLNHDVQVKITVDDPKKRPISAVADFNEVRNVASVEISEQRDITINLLFDYGHSLEERIISEQFTH